MNLQDIFDELTYGELSQLAAGGRYENSGSEPEIAESDRPQIVRHVATALTALYTRFRLREKSVDIQLIPGKSLYALDQRFSITNTTSNEPVKYLVDSEDDRFDNSVIKIEEVSNVTDEGVRGLKLNAVGETYSVRTPSMKTILVPDSFGLETPPTKLRVAYRASHPSFNIHLAIAAPMAVDIELPSTHLQALLFHVASRIMNPTGMVEEFHSGNSYYAKYEGECARLEQENVQIDNMARNTNFERQGFV